MEPTNLTVRILQEMRDELRGLRQEQRASTEMLRDEMRQSREEAAPRFEAIESTLRDLAQQLVMLARGVKVAIETRGAAQERLDAVEQRLEALERRTTG